MALGTEVEALLTRIATSVERIESTVTGQSVSKRRPGPGRAYIAARSFIRVQLLDGPKPWTEILAAGREHGHSKGTLERARPEVASKTYHAGQWSWRLKED